jgi:hypothetical protein
MVVLVLCLGLAPLFQGTPVAAAQDPAPVPESGGGDINDEATWQLALRVTSAPLEGFVMVDRGARDGLAVGDTVVLSPRNGGALEAIVREVFEDRATVELPSGAQRVPNGTRGVARLPRGRARGGTVERPGPTATGAPGGAASDPRSSEDATSEPSQQVGVEHGGWPDLDEGWTPDQPLLSSIGAVRPGDRARRVSGRAWTSFDSIFAVDGKRSDTFFRAGTEVIVENPFGAGGELVFDGEATSRSTHLASDSNADDQGESKLRLDRLYYEFGGTRFERDRWTFGRFLSRDLPELGVQDGVEWSRRLDGGHSIGVSAAFLPEPDADLDGTSDYGFSGWYRWVDDEREETMWTAAFHKSFHDGDADRDLVVLKAHHLPHDGWTYLATAWIDLHTDDAIDEGLALTEAHASAGRRFDGAHDLRLTYDHREYPELLREEFPAFGVESIADGALDRLGLAGSATLGGERRLSGRIGAWSDEDDGGGDVELGYEVRGVLVPGSRLRLAAFMAQGKFSALRGARIGLGRSEGSFDWEVFYELQEDSFEGFDGVNDDAVQHRVRATTERTTRSGWVMGLYTEVQLQDVEDVLLAGFHVGRSF